MRGSAKRQCDRAMGAPPRLVGGARGVVAVAVGGVALAGAAEVALEALAEARLQRRAGQGVVRGHDDPGDGAAVCLGFSVALSFQK